jgi:arsenate reductase
MAKSKVLFLCTGNSARSQMAEGLVNPYLGDTWEAFLAGTNPSGYVDRLAVQAMVELGIDLSAHRCDHALSSSGCSSLPYSAQAFGTVIA